MGYSETRRLHVSVPKLAGKANWTVWAPRVMEHLRVTDKNFINIVLGKSLCPPKPEDESLSDEQRAKIQKKINLWKAFNYRARIHLGNTLNAETGAQVQHLSGANEAWEKLNELYAEDAGAATDRCWAEFSNLRYKTSNVKAPEFIRMYQLALWQLRLAKIAAPHQLQISGFVQAVNDPMFSDFLNKLDIDRASPDSIDTVYACFLQFETEKNEDQPLDLEVFGASHDMSSAPPTAPVNNVKENENRTPPKGSKSQKSSKQRSTWATNSGHSNKKRPNPMQPTEAQTTEGNKRARISETQGEAGSTAFTPARSESPLFVAEEEENNLEAEDTRSVLPTSRDSQLLA